MFFVFNKEKITSYIVAFSTVAVLFALSIIVGKENVIEVASSYTDEKLKTYNVQIEGNNIIIKEGCNWNTNQIDIALSYLDEYKNKYTFCIDKRWQENNPEVIKEMKKRGFKIISLQ